MRGVEVCGVPRTALLAHLMGLAALAIMLALVAPAADAAERVAALPEAGPSPNPAPNSAVPEDDYYTRRAKTILDAEKAGERKPHPLAAPYPGMDVVVCEAGCPASGKPAIVFLRPHLVAATGAAGSTASETAGSMKPPACVGGCYADAGNGMEMQSAFVADPVPSEVGEWMTTTVQTPIVRDKLSPIR